jgi:hypothetical protein
MSIAALMLLAVAPAVVSGLDQACVPGSGPITWAELPTGGDLERLFSDRRDPPEVKTEIQCLLGSDGRPSRCVVTREDPPGFGFGAAALSVAPKFRMAAANGENLEGRCVSIPMTWKFE